MSVNFPTSIDVLTNPSSTDKVTSPSHADQHANANDAIEALEAKVGANSSIVTTSHDYKLSGITGTNKAASLTGAELLTNKKFADIYDTNGNEAISIYPTPSAINNFQIRNVAGTDSPILTAIGTPSNIPVWIYGKGSGKVRLGDAKIQYPDADGSPDQILKTDGSGNLSWVDQTSTPSVTELIPKPNFPLSNAATVATLNSSVTINLGQMCLPYGISSNKLSFYNNGAAADGKFQIGIYTADGATRKLNQETQTISGGGGGITTVALTSTLVLAPGIYYVAIVPKGAASIDVYNWTRINSAGITSLISSVSGEPVLEGTIVAASSSILPTTINPSAITAAANKTLIMRLDN